MRAATAAEAVMPEEAVLMVKVLVGVVLVVTISMVDADNNNSRQQATINNKLVGAMPCWAVATTEVAL